MVIPSRRIRVNKLQAARNQLHTAIWLAFHNGDPVSIMTLAHASHDVIRMIFRTKGFKDDLIYGASFIDAEYRDQWNRDIKEAPNFFKHANRGDPDEEIVFEEAMADMFMLMSCFALARMQVPFATEEEVLLSWFVLHFPNEANRKLIADHGIDVEALQKRAQSGRPEFYRLYSENLKKRG